MRNVKWNWDSQHLLNLHTSRMHTPAHCESLQLPIVQRLCKLPRLLRVAVLSLRAAQRHGRQALLPRFRPQPALAWLSWLRSTPPPGSSKRLDAMRVLLCALAALLLVAGGVSAEEKLKVTILVRGIA